MAVHESLDEALSRNAAVFADQVREAADMADTEEDIRIAIENQLAFVKREAGLTLTGKHEVTVVSGRIDSVYNRVIIEYKNPAGADRLGPKADSPETKKVVEQIKKRFYDLRTQLHHQLNTLFGVGTDGKYFVFVRFRDDKWQVLDPVEVNRYSAERFLWALYNLGQKGKPFSPEYLAGDFGSDSKLAQDGIRALYEAIKNTDHPKAQTFFNQWKILFGEVCGYDVDSPSEKIKKLAQYYSIREKGLAPAEMLFAVHTYYALFMKLLASEIVAFFHKLPTPLQKMMQSATSAKLKREMEELEAGSIFRHLNITNFLEGDLFAWYIPVWSEEIEQLVRQMVTRLDDYNPGTMSEDPAGSRDLLKKLYQQLFPKTVRHDLGEYYTPDWLADHVLNELEYVGDPDKRILDPACGSGTFLVMSIVRIRRWFDENRDKVSFDEGDLCRKILANVVGFDLNPLAVMAARTNYLIAIRDLIGHVEKVEIPIYLCDSILTPSEYGDLFTGKQGSARELKTAAARFLIPSEIATNREHVAKYAEQLEHCVRNGYEPGEFINRCREESLPVSNEKLHVDLYNELVTLDKANKNGVWARIIKNAFAPLFAGRFEFVAGNPPWVNWEHLPLQYRKSTEHLWVYYSLFTHTGLKARLGSAKDDVSILMTYVASDHFLKEHGRLGFVITQTVFKTVGGGAGFRRFSLPDGTLLGVSSVNDLVELQPFDGATNRTSTFTLQKGLPTKYPVRYVEWKRNRAIDSDLPLNKVQEFTDRQSVNAAPIDGNDVTSPWTTVSENLEDTLAKIIGKSAYKGRAGVCGWLNGVFWVSKLRTLSDSNVLIQNLATGGKKEVEQLEATVEPNWVFPLLRGREISRWKAAPEMSIIAPVISGDESKAIPETQLRKQWPKTFQYLNHFRNDLTSRSGYKKYLGSQPFYAQYNIGPYTFSQVKVCWLRISNDLTAAVVKDTVPDNGVTFVSLGNDERAGHFLCGMLNSLIIRWAIGKFSVAGTGTWGSPQILTRVRIPSFDPLDGNHVAIEEAADTCARLASVGETDEIRRAEAELDKLVAKLFGLSETEMRRLTSAFLELRSAKRTSKGRKGRTHDRG